MIQILSFASVLMAFAMVIGGAVGIPYMIQRIVLGNPSPSAGMWVKSVAKYAIIIGGASFLAGFLGPIVLAPDANQGPLLGIFITGPVGFLAGAGVGSFLGFRGGENA